MRLVVMSLLAGLAMGWVAQSAGVAAAETAPVEREWTVAGTPRKALVYAPRSATKSKTPVVFAFHGHGGAARHAARTFAYHTHWPEAIVVYPQGLNTPGRLTDPEGKKAGWQHGPGEQQDRDLEFFDAVLTSLKTDYQVDARRVYATGHSNGGAFTYLLWASRGDVLAAVAPSAAVFARGVKDLKPKPVLHVAGEADALVRYAWQRRMINEVRKLNGCQPEGKPWDKAGELVGTEYPSEKGTPCVTLIGPGGHKFPEEAPKLIVKFFQQHGG